MTQTISQYSAKLSLSTALRFGSRSALSKIPQQFHQLTVGISTVQSSNVVRDLGVHFDSELTMKQHVSKVVSVCYYQLRKLHHLWRLVNQTVSFVLSRIDYCNSLLINLPTSTIAPLRVQNDAAHLVLGVDHRAHITPVLKQPHWLPVPYRVQFKIATVMHQVYHHHCHQMRPDNAYITATRVAVSVRTRTNLGRRAFSVAGPSVWNILPSSLRLIDSHKQFRRQLKTYYFNVAFS